MLPLILIVFILQAFIHVVSSVGAAAVNEILWILFNKLPTPTSGTVRKNLELKQDVLRLKKEMNGVSPQDEFSKWAKLRRQHDKVSADYEKNASELKGFKGQFDSVAGALRWLSTTGLRFLLQFWFQKQPIFWLPNAWFPSYIEWLLSFPKAPIGSVSIQIWWMACASTVSLAAEAITAASALGRARKEQTGQSEKATGRQQAQAGKGQFEKKDL